MFRTCECSSSPGPFIRINMVCQFVKIIKENQISNKLQGTCSVFLRWGRVSPLAVGEDTVVWSRMSSLAGWLRGHCSMGKSVPLCWVTGGHCTMG